MKQFFCFSVLFAVVVFGGLSCSTIEKDVKPDHEEKLVIETGGVYHKLLRGQTLWRIAKAYDVNINDIIQANKIPNVAQVEENQLLFIPGAKEVKAIPVVIDGIVNDFTWPIKGKILSFFHDYQEHRFNNGIDIEAQEGDIVKAARAGKVVFADHLAGYGETVIIDHLDGFHSVYADNAELLVKRGDVIEKNHPISHVGRLRDVAYLHFEIRKNSQEDNPLYYLP